MQNRCQVFKVGGHDPTGENAMECNAPAEYCPTCDMSVCAECHVEMTPSHALHEKKPPVAVGEWESESGWKISG